MTDKSCINCKFIEECIRRSLTPDKSLEIYINCIRKDERSKLESEMEELREDFKLNVLRLAEKEGENVSLRKENAGLKKEIKCGCNKHKDLFDCQLLAEMNDNEIKELKSRWSKLEEWQIQMRF